MLKKIDPTYKNLLIRHILAWLSVIIFYTLYSTVEGSLIVKSGWIFLLIINYSFAYYTLVLFIWPKIISERKVIYSILIFFSFIFFCSFFYFQLSIVTPWLGGRHEMINWPFYRFINNSLRIFAYIFFTSIGTYFNWIGIKKIKEDLKADSDIIEMEFLFLKNQFHSHLTFNFLNFCYNKVRVFSPSTANSIEQFSEILRYSLTASSDNPALLENEITYIENYISFQKFLTPNLNVRIVHRGELTNIFVLPKVLGTLVELFLKNEVLNTSQSISTIFIESSKHKIIFKVENKEDKRNFSIKDEELLFINQILQSSYKDNYHLQISNEDNLFSCELKLNDYREL